MAIINQSLYNDTVALLDDLNDSQLMAVHAIILELADVHNRFKSPLGIENEEALLNHIDSSLEQAKSGIGIDADEAISSLMQEFDLWKVSKSK